MTADGCIGFDEMTFTVNNCIGVDEISNFKGVYPNPVQDFCTLWTGNDNDWKLMDVQGRTLAQFTLPKNQFVQLNMSYICTTGFYLLKSNNDEYKIVVEQFNEVTIVFIFPAPFLAGSYALFLALNKYDILPGQGNGGETS